MNLLGGVAHYHRLVAGEAVKRQQLLLQPGSILTEGIEHSRVLPELSVQVFELPVQVGLEPVELGPVYLTIYVFLHLGMGLLPGVLLQFTKWTKL